MDLETFVIVVMTVCLSTKPTIITVARNPTPPVETGMETFIVMDKNCGVMSHVMDLVDKQQNMDSPCYPVLTKRNVI